MILHVYPTAAADGPLNMATDEFLLEKAQQGQASFRWYSWEPATLSLGYFQPHAERMLNPQWCDVPWVRRSTGGGAIWHEEEITYALALPADILGKQTPASWHDALHLIMVAALRHAGIAATFYQGIRPKRFELDYLCFTVPQPGDVLVSGTKIIGGAQRIKHGALLQHGSIRQPYGQILAQSWLPFLVEQMGWQLQWVDWTVPDRAAIQALAEKKYRQVGWNEKR